jgi:hypothetical protein
MLTNASPRLPSFDVSTSSLICPSNESWRVPDPYDCSIYHDCYHGTDLISYCPGQLQYNPNKQTCDHPQNVQCREYLWIHKLIIVCIGKNKCTIKNEGARFLHPTSCCHFYQCISGQLILQTCLQPNLFDLQTRQCLSYKKVKCDERRQCLNKCKSIKPSKILF